ncbi:MAG: hypothetical protein NTW86_22235 [Candidatus Sumerlaeota bacterium]|nr:hypothetical protein [Candidatus Sumerlaeota bacterium]
MRSIAILSAVLAFFLSFHLGLCAAGDGDGPAESDLVALRDGFDARRDAMLQSQIDDPYPEAKESTDGKSQMNLYVWHYLDFALAALYRNQRVPEANDAVLKACEHYKRDRQEMLSSKGFYWSGNLFLRVYELFHGGSRFFPGRLRPDVEKEMLERMWDWGRTRARVEEAKIDESQTWRYWGSENHDAMRKSTAWGVAQILKDNAPYNTYVYDDGTIAQEQCDAWTAYFNEYLRERAKKGLLQEIGSPTYAKYTIQGWYNFADFAHDPTLRRRASQLLNLYWTVWAEDQIDGVCGGGKARYYQPSSRATDDAMYSAGWYYLNIGRSLSQHPGLMCLATSAYRMPLLTMDLALDVEGRGSYESTERRMGLAKTRKGEADFEELRTDTGGIVRYTWHTPEFVMGTLMVEARPLEDWRAGSAQNRWGGVIFRGHPDARLYPQCEGLGNGKTYNQQWSVQKKGALIAQKLTGKGMSKQAGAMRVWFSAPGLSNRVEESGWVFVEAPGAWAAARPVAGGYEWEEGGDKSRGQWLRCLDDTTPVILQVARKGDFADYKAFRAAVLAAPLAYQNHLLTYMSLEGDRLTLHADYSAPPEINGAPVDYAPPKTFDSPFIQEDWNSGVVTLSKGARTLTLDFNSIEPEPRGM